MKKISLRIAVALVLLLALCYPAYAHIASTYKWGSSYVYYDSEYSGTDATNRIKEAANDWNSKVPEFDFLYTDTGGHDLKSGSCQPGNAAETDVTIGSGETTTIDDCDTRFSTALSWYYGTGTPSSSQFDFLSVCKHEFGHWYMLWDCTTSTHSSYVMYKTINNGQVKRTINSHDYTPARDMY